jgi:hypothetical protein
LWLACTQMVLTGRDGNIVEINAPLEADFEQVLTQLSS